MNNSHFISKAKTRNLLGIGRLRYQQLIDSKILPEPIKLADSGRPVHTLAQIETARNNLYKKAVMDSQPVSGKRMKPFSAKLVAEIHNAR